MSLRQPSTWLLAALLPALAAPPAVAQDSTRLRLIELELRGAQVEALALTERQLHDNPQTARLQGLEYLRGHLLAALGRGEEAAGAYAAALGNPAELVPYARFRLALSQQQLGHPEVAAGLVATLLGSDPTPALLGPAVRLLHATISQGGDCRLLIGLENHRLPVPERRELDLARADCQLRGGAPDKAAARFAALLAESTGDLVALEAAERLLALPPPDGPAAARQDALLGLVWNAHRDFDRSAQVLERALQRVAAAPGILPDGLEYEARYALLRDHFWSGRYRAAAGGFETLAKAGRGAAPAAQALFQAGRSWELLGEWPRASACFLRTAEVDPTGEMAASALFSALRLEWRSGHEAEALELDARLLTQPRWRSSAGRAALFLAASDLVRARADRASGWLGQAAAVGAAAEEVAYWRGRREELLGHPEAAVQAYVEVLRLDPFHPMAGAARQRLANPVLAPAARSVALRGSQAGSSKPELYGAWLLLGDADPRGEAARLALLRSLLTDRRAAPLLGLATVPPERWPLWHSNLDQAEELLLGLGLWAEGAPSVLRHFPASNPDLAFTGSTLLNLAGETRRSLYVAEVLLKRAPEGLPARLLPPGFRRLLYPLPFRAPLEAQAARQQVDPFLLASLLREESRFDPRAVSAASARGLSQFVLPTARRIGALIGLPVAGPADLDRPDTSIALGAAYLAELLRRFPGGVEQAVAAYNAGEPQAGLWQAYCYSADPAEYFTKISFKETRGYVADVLTSREQYADLYGGGGT